MRLYINEDGSYVPQKIALYTGSAYKTLTCDANGLVVSENLTVGGSSAFGGNMDITKSASNIVLDMNVDTGQYSDYQLHVQTVLDKIMRVSSTGWLFMDRNPATVNLFHIGDSLISAYKPMTIGGSLTIENQGAGADPILSSNDAAQHLTVTG